MTVEPGRADLLHLRELLVGYLVGVSVCIVGSGFTWLWRVGIVVATLLHLAMIARMSQSSDSPAAPIVTAVPSLVVVAAALILELVPSVRKWFATDYVKD
ncbi:MAG: hypothetical protein QM770_07315 [Tepidisphaeraceae bacterium]